MLRLDNNQGIYGPIPKEFEKLSDVSLQTGHETTQLCYGGPDGVSASWAEEHLFNGLLSVLECDAFSVTGYYLLNPNSEPPIEWDELLQPHIDEKRELFADWGSRRHFLYGFERITGTFTIRPEVESFAFEPRSRTVFVPPAAQNVNFSVRRQAVPDYYEYVAAGNGFTRCHADESQSSAAELLPVAQKCEVHEQTFRSNESYTTTEMIQLLLPIGGGVDVKLHCYDQVHVPIFLQVERLTVANQFEFADLLFRPVATARLCDVRTLLNPVDSNSQPPFFFTLREGEVHMVVSDTLPVLQQDDLRAVSATAQRVLLISTPVVTVIAESGDEFTLSHHRAFEETKVAAITGDLALAPENDALPPFTLQAGQQATVNRLRAGPDPEQENLFLPAVLR